MPTLHQSSQGRELQTRCSPCHFCVSKGILAPHSPAQETACCYTPGCLLAQQMPNQVLDPTSTQPRSSGDTIKVLRPKPS